MRSSIVTLQTQLEQARERLKDVEDNIKKSTGRDFAQNNANRQVFKRTARHFDEPESVTPAGGAPFKKRVSDVKGRLGDWVQEEPPRVNSTQRPGFGTQRSVIPIQGRIVTRPFSQGIPRERDTKVEETPRIPARQRLDNAPNSAQPAMTVFSRLSGPPKEEEVEKLKITSQVLVQETPSRKEILAAQSKDKSCKERNRRMFGALLGTLQKFRQEESKLKEKEEKKAQVERKVEEAAEREKEEAKKARRELFTSRRQEQMNIRHLEFKLTKLKQLGEWEVNKNKLMPFIQTEAQPKIFYLPKKHNDKTKKLLESHQTRIQKAIEKKRVEIEKLIEAHVPPVDESKDDDNDQDEPEDGEIDTTMDISENLDDTTLNDTLDSDKLTPLLPTASDIINIKQERKSSDKSSDSNDSSSDSSTGSDRSRDKRKHKRRKLGAKGRSSSDNSSDSDSGSDSSAKEIKTENRTSDKENISQSSPEVKIKIEAT